MNFYSGKLYILCFSITIGDNYISTAAIIAIDNYRMTRIGLSRNVGRSFLFSREKKKKMRGARSVLILVRKVFSNGFHVRGKSWRAKLAWGLDFISRTFSFVFLSPQRRQTRKSNEIIEHKEYNHHAAQRHRISLRVNSRKLLTYFWSS